MNTPDGGVTITGWSVPTQLGDTPFQQALSNLSWGRAIVNVYTANYPEPAEPMGCCNNAEVRTLLSYQWPALISPRSCSG